MKQRETISKYQSREAIAELFVILSGVVFLEIYYLLLKLS